MADRVAKAALFDGLVTAAKALASGRRAEIVDILAQGERPVEEIATEIEQSVANTSQHLQQLLRAGLVRTRRDGNRIYYALADEGVSELWAMLRIGSPPIMSPRSNGSPPTTWATAGNCTPSPAPN